MLQLMSARRYSDEQALEIVSAYRAGESMPSLATRYGGSKTTVSKLFRRIGFNARGPGGYEPIQLTETDRAEIIRLYVSGEFSQKQIGARYRVRQSVVSHILRSGGVYNQRNIKGGMRHPLWKGGRIMRGGYPLVSLEPDSPFYCMTSSGYVLEHRLVMAEHLGRPLASHETVHHIDGDSTNPKIENLQLRSGPHGKGAVARCLDCGSAHIGFERLA